MLSPRQLFSILLLGLTAATSHASDIQQLVQQLDANEFSKRKAATQQLSDRGVAALPAIVEAATSESREVAVRAHSILKRHLETGDAETRNAAKAALAQLAQGEGAAARRAQQTLEPKPDPNGFNRIFAPGGRIVINAQGGARIQVRQVGGNGRQIQIQQLNGVKNIRVEENGQKVEIQEDPKNGIKVEVTEKKDGKQITKKYAAKSAAELQKKHPDAYKIYEKHRKQNGGVQIRIAQGNAPLRPQAPPPAQDPKDHFDRVKKAFDERIKEYQQKAEQAEGQQKEMYQRMIETFKRQRKLVEDLERRQLPKLPAPQAPSAEQFNEVRKRLEQQQAEIATQAEARRAQMQKEIEAIADRVEQANRTFER